MDSARPSRAEHYINRELSLLEFNRRVLAQAPTSACRCSSGCVPVHLVAQPRRVLRDPRRRPEAAARARRRRSRGPTASAIAEQLRGDPRARARAGRRAVPPASTTCCCRRSRRRASRCSPRADWDRRRSAPGSSDYFAREVEPVLTPLGLDPAHPFPRILNKSLNFIVRARGQGRLRPRQRAGHRAGAALAAARRSALPRRAAAARTASCSCRPSSQRVRATSCSPAWRCWAATSSASRATATCSSTRKKSRTCARALEGELRAAPLRRRGAPRGRRQLPDRHGRLPAAAVRARPSTTCYRCHGPVNLNRLLGDLRPGRPRRTSSTRRSRPALPRARWPARTTCSRRSAQQRRAAAPSVPSLRAGDRFPAPGGRRPARARDQADAVPHRHRFADRRCAGRGGAAPARTSRSSSSCARASTRKPTSTWPTGCRKPARTSCTAWSATRRTPR